MKLKENYVLRQIAESWVILPVAGEALNFTGMMTLNDSGAMLWRVLEKDCSVEALTQALVSYYSNVSEEQAKADAEYFIQKLIKIGCIEE